MGPLPRAASSSSTAAAAAAASQHHPYSTPAMVNLVAGGGAGVVETTLTYPLDLARTRIQMHRGGGGGGGSGASSSSLLGVLRAVEREGGVHQLYRGLLPPLVSEVPRRALKFTANDAYTQVLFGKDGGQGMNQSVTGLASMDGWMDDGDARGISSSGLFFSPKKKSHALVRS